MNGIARTINRGLICCCICLAAAGTGRPAHAGGGDVGWALGPFTVRPSRAHIGEDLILWRVQVQLPTRMGTLHYVNGTAQYATTAAGRYYIAAVSAFMEGPCDPSPGPVSDDLYDVSPVLILGR